MADETSEVHSSDERAYAGLPRKAVDDEGALAALAICAKKTLRRVVPDVSGKGDDARRGQGARYGLRLETLQGPAIETEIHFPPLAGEDGDRVTRDAKHGYSPMQRATPAGSFV
jgi:hypothetical protein